MPRANKPCPNTDCRNYSPCSKHESWGRKGSNHRPLPRGWKTTAKNFLAQPGNDRCASCAARASIVKLAVDHIIPRACGGPDIAENFQALCSDCHLRKTRADRARCRETHHHRP